MEASGAPHEPINADSLFPRQLSMTSFVGVEQPLKPMASSTKIGIRITYRVLFCQSPSKCPTALIRIPLMQHPTHTSSAAEE